MSTLIDTGASGDRRSSVDSRHRPPRMTTLLILVGLIWLLVIVIAGEAGLFEAGPGRPPLPLAVAIVLPLAIFLVAYRLSETFRQFVLGLDLRLLTAVQAWRVLGGVFLFLYGLSLGPALFSLPAGVGDVAVGIAAVFVLLAMLDGRPNWRRGVLLLNLGGLLDFAVAIATGILTSNSALGLFAPATPMPSMGLLPLSLVPSFLVPLWTLFHFASLLQLRRTAGGSS